MTRKAPQLIPRPRPPNPNPKEDSSKLPSRTPISTPPVPAARTVPEVVLPRADKRTKITFYPDTLGESVKQACQRLREVGFERLCSDHRGPSCITPASSLPHPAARWLEYLRRHGAPVITSTAPWSKSRIDRALRRGCHKSALEHGEFLRQEMAEMIKSGHWLVLPARSVRDLPNLRLAPIGVVPQRDRRPRTIVDYSYYGTNDATQPLVPNSMQFGRALNRVLTVLEQADTRRGPLMMMKLDIADAFMRVPLQLASIPKLAALLPRYPGEPQLVAFPLVLPMGWVNSPAWFCAVSETLTDLANQSVASDSPHRLSELADSRPARIKRPGQQADMLAGAPKARTSGRLRPPVCYHDVYMDDIIGIHQGSRADRTRTRDQLLHTVDLVLRPLSNDDNPHRKEPTSTKKLQKGDAYWSTRKVILGWVVDTVQRTIELPPHRIQRLSALLDEFHPGQRTTSRRKWQQLLGELRSMALALPASRGLFSQLQATLDYPSDPSPHDRIRLTPETHDALRDFRFVAASLGERPTRWRECIPTEVCYTGAQDASAAGMGGIWLPANDSECPLLWRHRFPASTTDSVVSLDNPAGTLTNSDLELAAHVAAHDVLTSAYDVREKSVYALSDNSPTISWAQRGSVSTDSVRAYLLRLHALHQRQHRYLSQQSHIPGKDNVLADLLSRQWHLTDSDVLSLFNSRYPQKLPWRLCPLRPRMICAINSALSKQRCEPASLLNELQSSPPPLINGLPSVPPTTVLSTSPRKSPPYHGSSSLHRSTGPTHSLAPPVSDPSAIGQWRKPAVLWRRRTPAWDTQIPAVTQRAVFTKPSASSSPSGHVRMTLPLE
jgi:hypothetical protein